jgi:hypothetical protein
MSAWRSSMSIVILRYLYFGLADLEISSQISRSPTPTPAAPEASHPTTYDMPDDLLRTMKEETMDYEIEENVESYFDPDHLSPEAHMTDPFSRSPSPMPSPRPSDTSITFDHWHRRYDIHNEATAQLYQSLSTLTDYEDASYLRYALLPLMVLALISRPDSNERTLSLGLFERFKSSMAYQGATPNPIGGSALDFDIPWQKLDAYSTKMEQQRRDDVVFVESQLLNSAPEWNWWLMLKHMNLQTICEC